VVKNEKKKSTAKASAQHYKPSYKKAKSNIRDDFVYTTRYNRKYAIHVLSNYGLKKIRYIDGKAV
jgi:hypothetical protein